MKLCLILFAALLELTTSSWSSVLQIRGGIVPQAKDSGADYFEQFHLDYGTKDNKRFAGALRGFIASGKLSSLPESDPFFKWLNEHLEKGPEPVNGRLKPFYAADFGTKQDLKKGENPKVMIVQRKLKWDKNGMMLPLGNDVDVEVREIWQPWLKSKCNFVARYIVPSRVNIIKVMEAKGRFLNELELDEDADGRKVAWAKMTFKPTIGQRLRGKKDVVIRRALDASKLVLMSSTRAFGSGVTPAMRPTGVPALPSLSALIPKVKLPQIGGKFGKSGNAEEDEDDEDDEEN